MRRPPLPPLPLILLLPLLLLLREGAARVFTVGYITGSRRRPGDLEYTRPGLTISGAASLAVAEVNGEPTPPPGHQRAHHFGEAKRSNAPKGAPPEPTDRGFSNGPSTHPVSLSSRRQPHSHAFRENTRAPRHSRRTRAPPTAATNATDEDGDEMSSETSGPGVESATKHDKSPKSADISLTFVTDPTPKLVVNEATFGRDPNAKNAELAAGKGSEEPEPSTENVERWKTSERGGATRIPEAENVVDVDGEAKEDNTLASFAEGGSVFPNGQMEDNAEHLQERRWAQTGTQKEEGEVGGRFAKEIDYGSVVGVTAGGGMETAGGEVVSAGRVFGGDPGRVLRALGHRLELRVAETYGEEAESIRAAAKLWRDGVDAYLGPQETCLHEGRMAAAFNLPMVSYFCTHRETSDKKRYPTFARTRPPDSQISKSVTALLLHFNWTQVAFLHQISLEGEFSAVASTILAALQASGIGVRVQRTWNGPFYFGYMENPFHQILEETRHNARVYVVLGHYYEHVGLLIAMDEMKMLDTGEYFVVGVDTEPYDASSPTKYFGGPLVDEPHPRAAAAFRSYLGVLPSASVLLSSAPPRPFVLRPSHQNESQKDDYADEESNEDLTYTVIPSSAQEAADRFSALVNTYMELPPFSFKNPLVSLGGALKIPPEAAYLYDAVHVYTRALEKVLLSDGDPRNGTAIAEAMRGTRYLSAMGYVVSLDNNGDAEGNYTIIGRRHVSSVSGGFAMVPVGRLYPPEDPSEEETASRDTLTLPELRMLVPVDWAGGAPPLAEPPCGFEGEKCITYTGEIVGTVAGGVVLALAIISLVLYRNWRYEQALDSLLWKVDFKDIQMSEAGEQPAGQTTGTNGNAGNTGNTNRITRPLIRTSQASLSSNPDAEWRRGVAYTPVGIYRNRPLAVKKMQSPRQRPMAVDRAMKKELKMMRDLRHDNLICFIGACTDPPNVCILTEYCARGSLRDILENEDLKLDNMFIASLLGDIIRGMIFLHDSPIRSHGSLRPSNCLVDSRWVLKIADFGLHKFKREADVPPFKHMAAYYPFSSNGPTAFKGHSTSGDSGSKTSSSRRKRGDSGAQVNENSAMEALVEAKNYIETMLYRAPELLRAMLCSLSLPLPSPDHSADPSVCKEEGRVPAGVALSRDLPSDPVQLAAVLACAWSARTDLWQGTQRGDTYSFALVAYELHARQGPLGMNANSSLTHTDILKRVIAGPRGGNSSFRPSLDLLETSFDFVRDCIKECWNEIPEERPDFRTVRLRLRPMRKGMKPNIFDNMMAMMEKYANNLEQLVDERTDQLIVEKRKTDALLYEMLPKSVAEQLKRGHRVEAESYDCVTIYFSDIVGFTAMSAESTPLQVVDFLNDLYTCFDSILENYDVYKVETIGDAYMVVSGLPIRNGIQHAGEIASMSLHLLDAVKHFQIRHMPKDPLMLRIGIHSGPVCAGVVGHKMPRYCLFGDTVNTASRMESNGIPLKIHCSSECRALLDQLGGYRLASRGLVQMKGKGDVQTHWLLGEEGDEEEGESGEDGAEGRCAGTARARANRRESRKAERGKAEAEVEQQAEEEKQTEPKKATAAPEGDRPEAGNRGAEGQSSAWRRFEEFSRPEFDSRERGRRGCSEGREKVVRAKETRNSDDALLSRKERATDQPPYNRACSAPLNGKGNKSNGRSEGPEESKRTQGHAQQANALAPPIRSSMRKNPGEWLSEAGQAARVVPGRSSLRKGIGVGNLQVGMSPGYTVHRRRRSLESSPKRLRFASEVTGEDSGREIVYPKEKAVKEMLLDCRRVQKDLGLPLSKKEKDRNALGWEPAEKPFEDSSLLQRGEKRGKVKKPKKSKGREGDRKVASSEWCNFLLSNTVPPWRRKGKSAEYLEREDSGKWDEIYGCRHKSRSPTSYLSKNIGHLDPYGYFNDASMYLSSEPSIPKVRSLMLMNERSLDAQKESAGEGYAYPLVMHVNKSEDGLINERSLRIGDYAGLRGAPQMDGSRLSVPQTDPGFYSSTSCESNQSYDSYYEKGGNSMFVTPSISVSLSVDPIAQGGDDSGGPSTESYSDLLAGRDFQCPVDAYGVESSIGTGERVGKRNSEGAWSDQVIGGGDLTVRASNSDTGICNIRSSDTAETLNADCSVDDVFSDVARACGGDEAVRLLLEDCEGNSELLPARSAVVGVEMREIEEGLGSGRPSTDDERDVEPSGVGGRNRRCQTGAASEDDEETSRPLLLPSPGSDEMGI